MKKYRNNGSKVLKLYLLYSTVQYCY